MRQIGSIVIGMVLCLPCSLGWAQSTQESIQPTESNRPTAPDRKAHPMAERMTDQLSRMVGKVLGSPASPRRSSLMSVAELMRSAQAQLAERKTDQAAQAPQTKALAMLDELIAQALQQEKQCQQQQQQSSQASATASGGAAAVGGTPSAPMQQSSLPGGQGQVGALGASPIARPGEVWGQMPPKQREKVLQSIGQQFPGPYRQLIEQYYTQLAKEP